jgi:glutathione S-transferase
MELLFSAASPFVRKVSVCARELGLTDRITETRISASPVNRNASLVARNPLGKLPTLITDNGTPLFDSPVICEYRDSLANGGRVFPAPGPKRWLALVEQATADGLLDAGILIRYEMSLRPEANRWPGWVDAQMAKINASLAQLETHVAAFANRVDIGTISVGCALGWLDFRFADLGWRNACPTLATWFANFDERSSMRATRPAA